MGGSNSNTGETMRFFSMKAKADASLSPSFTQSEKVEGSWKNTNVYDTITGMLCSASIETKDFNDGAKNFFTLILEDEEGKFKVSMSHNDLSYSIISSLASNCNSLSNFTIKLWKKESDDGKYWNGRAAVTADGQKTSWKIAPNTAPKKELITKKDGKTPLLKDGKNQYDDEDRRLFWEKFFKENIVAALGETPAKKSAPAASDEDDDNDHLPF